MEDETHERVSRMFVMAMVFVLTLATVAIFVALLVAVDHFFFEPTDEGVRQDATSGATPR